ncbi:MAG: hypothetical protein R2731_03125 [Nocardioides sp.]
MANVLARNFLGSLVMLIIGIILASVTVVGLISSQVNSAGTNSSVDSTNPVIDYGSTS